MSNWTQEREDKLRMLWATGISAARIACQLGGFDHCVDGGRSAVIGKLNRLKLHRPPEVRRRQSGAHARRSGTPWRGAKKTAPKPKRPWSEPKRPWSEPRKSWPEPQTFATDPTPVREHPLLASANPKVLLDLEPGDCRWPHGDAREGTLVFCASTDKPTPSLPYCRAHAAIAYQTTKMLEVVDTAPEREVAIA